MKTYQNDETPFDVVDTEVFSTGLGGDEEFFLRISEGEFEGINFQFRNLQVLDNSVQYDIFVDEDSTPLMDDETSKRFEEVTQNIVLARIIDYTDAHKSIDS